ncbi:MAG: SurA N-terminal domain-containing protein [Deltaproteobacteria bacterium]|nr:MAG: SurA N-terminal domain-containing protein [Deltaproteobacteria bacterium]
MAISGAGPAPDSPKDWLVNRIVAAVNNEVITLRELEAECEFQLIIQAAPGSRESLNPHHSRDFQQKVLEGMINQILILEEAQRIGLTEINKEELAGRLRDFKQRFTSEDEFSKFLRRWGLKREGLEERFKAQIIAARFIERMIVLPSEPGGEALGRQEERIRAFQKKLAKQIEELRGKADIRFMEWETHLIEK